MQLMDLFGDFAVESMKQNVLIPDVYDLYYKSHRGTKIYIRSDMDLMAMFTSLDGFETIHIWLEDTIDPMKEFGLYFELKKKQEEREREAEEMAKLERESEHIEPLSMEIPVVDIETNKTIFMRFYTSQELHDEPPPSPPPTATPHTATPKTQTQPPPPFTQNNSPESQNIYANNEANTQPPPATQNTPPETQTRQCPTSDRFSQQSSQEIPCSNPPKKSQRKNNIRCLKQQLGERVFRILRLKKVIMKLKVVMVEEGETTKNLKRMKRL